MVLHQDRAAYIAFTIVGLASSALYVTVAIVCNYLLLKRVGVVRERWEDSLGPRSSRRSGRQAYRKAAQSQRDQSNSEERFSLSEKSLRTLPPESPPGSRGIQSPSLQPSREPSIASTMASVVITPPLSAADPSELPPAHFLPPALSLNTDSYDERRFASVNGTESPMPEGADDSPDYGTATKHSSTSKRHSRTLVTPQAMRSLHDGPFSVFLWRDEVCQFYVLILLFCLASSISVCQAGLLWTGTFSRTTNTISTSPGCPKSANIDGDVKSNIDVYFEVPIACLLYYIATTLLLHFVRLSDVVRETSLTYRRRRRYAVYGSLSFVLLLFCGFCFSGHQYRIVGIWMDVMLSCVMAIAAAIVGILVTHWLSGLMEKSSIQQIRLVCLITCLTFLGRAFFVYPESQNGLGGFDFLVNRHLLNLGDCGSPSAFLVQIFINFVPVVSSLIALQVKKYRVGGSSTTSPSVSANKRTGRATESKPLLARTLK